MPNTLNLSSDRAAARLAFAEEHLNCSLQESVASADASFRSYWRMQADSQSWIVMDAPPERENCLPFIDISARLRQKGLCAPTVLAQDLSQGFLLLDDLGTRMLLPELNTDSVERLYGDALNELTQLAEVDCNDLPNYDAGRLGAEMDLFPEWFLRKHLDVAITAQEESQWQQVRAALIASAENQPQVFVHRDFHSRNLMLGDNHPQASDRYGILDFQDAVRGPISYDAVSLLRDCYIAWPEARVSAWCERFRLQAGIAMSSADFARAFDWMGLQRHLKVLGIFARLNYRDGKSRYLLDLPLVLHYTMSIAQRYQELQSLVELLRRYTCDVDLTQPRFSA